MSILSVENLSHGFGDKVLFKDVSFRLLKGEKIGLVGNNGAGKTTLFNILVGKLLPDTGEVKWSTDAKIGYLDQHSKLEEGKTIEEILRTAFKDLYDIESKIINLSDSLASASEEEMEKTLKRLGNLQDILDSSNFYSIDSSIGNVASGLGLTALGMDTPVDKLSGGQRTKVLLAKLLLSNSELLLLDEPTNYLDKEHVAWLIEYLNSYKNSFIVISHDTNFLNSVVNVIYHIEFTTMKRYAGNYDNFIKMEKLEKERYIEQYYRQQEEIKRLEQFVKSNIVRASTTKRAQSRQKQLDKIERLEKPKSNAKPKFVFETARDTTKLIFESKGLEIGYKFPIMRNINLKLSKNKKVALIGCNGIGKSTFLKTIMGVLPKLHGEITYGEYLEPAYYEQEIYNKSEITPFQYIQEYFPKMIQKDIRRALAQCGLKEEHIFENMKKLSGGEQSKVRMCRLVLTPSNWLLLDEPTNHLDVSAKEALKESLINYEGTILLVCHEKEFYEDWVDEVWNMEKLLKVASKK